ncbi:Protein N-terminal amidase [Apiospora arundinis]|uniref:Protein N-terminal amidase n=1 Tax=Apiospora arundinis TaxID=335852 RepID=A0ABR2I8I5_9PEZI
MRIACLQFAPQVGDIDNNLNRADAVLSKANPEDLDLLVLPELAFTGYNFKSLQAISPYLEPSGSGISSLWARTTALKYNCVVAVGYPEKVDVASRWPTSPEYYNSLILVNGEGETVANYRKSHLYYTDETWALEGTEGFFAGHIPGLGHCSMGICMDLNPYKFESPWHSFEFAFHVLDTDSNIVILSMAWNTREDARHFSRMPKEPDMETLTYWVTRLEPLIRTDSDEEIIVIFCNRTGIEDDAVYAGTSAVIGVRDGEVNVYGMLGRGEKELLVIDTDNAPFAKLVYRPEGESATSSQVGDKSEVGQTLPPPPSSEQKSSSSEAKNRVPTPQPTAAPRGETTEDSNPRLPKPISTSGVTQSPKRKTRPQSPKIEIPYSPSLAEVAAKLQHDAANGLENHASPGVPTPTGPSPTPQAVRPYFEGSESPIKSAQQHAHHVATPHPNAKPTGDTRIFGGHVLISHDLFTPTTPFEDQIPASPRYFWMPDEHMLKSPMGRREWTPANAESATYNFKTPLAAQRRHSHYAIAEQPMETSEETQGRSQSARLDDHVSDADNSDSQKANVSSSDEEQPLRPASPKSRNASRTGRLERSDSSLSHRPDVNVLSKRLESMSFRPGSAAAERETISSSDDSQPDRPSSPKSRNASRSRPMLSAEDLIAEHRQGSVSRNSMTAGISLDKADKPQVPLSMFNKANSGSPRPGPRAGYGRSNSITDRAMGRPGSRGGDPWNRMAQGSRIERPQSRSMHSAQAPNIPEAMSDGAPSRTQSRGRLPDIEGPITDGNRIVPPERSQSRRGWNRPDESIPRGRTREQRSMSNHAVHGAHGPFETEITRISPNCPVHGSHHDEASQPTPTPQDIVETEIIRTSPSCPVHGQGHEHGHGNSSSSRQPTGRVSGVTTPPETRSMSRNGNVTSPDPQAAVPALRGSSVKTIITPKDSPATPPYEPRTPKAMVLLPGDDDLIPQTALTAPIIQNMKCVEKETLNGGIMRPKSAVW